MDGMAAPARHTDLQTLRAEAEMLVQRHVFGSVRRPMQALARRRGLIPDRTAGAPTNLDFEPSRTRGPSTDQAQAP